MPMAERIARSFSRDDEYESEALLSLCEAVLAYRPDRSASIDDYVGMCIRSRLLNLKDRERLRFTDSLDLSSKIVKVY